MRERVPERASNASLRRAAAVRDRLQRLGALEAADAWEQSRRELSDAAAELAGANRRARRAAAVLDRQHAAAQFGVPSASSPPAPATSPSSPAPASKRRRRELQSDGGSYVRALERRHRRETAYLERHRQRCKDRGMLAPSPLIPVVVWTIAADILSDTSGRAARIHLSRARNHVAVGALRVAALGCDAFGRARRSYVGRSPSAERARRIIALGLSLLALAKVARRRGRYTGFISGITRGALLALLRDPWTGETLHPNALSGVHRPGAAVDSGQLGYLRALERAGFLYRQQLPPSCCEAFERFGEWASNRYWIVTADASSGHLHEVVRRELQRLQQLGAELAALAELLLLQPRPPRRSSAPAPRPAPS